MQYPNVQSKYAPLIPIIGFAIAAGLTTIGTPPANSNLRELILSVTEMATTGTTGEYPVSIYLDSIEIYTENIYLGGTGAGNSGTLFQQTLKFNERNFSSGSNGKLEVSLSNALTAGKVQINAYFD